MMNNIIVLDTFTIISGIVLLVVAVVSSFFSPFVRFRRRREEDGGDESEAEKTPLPPLSVILTPHDEAGKIEQNLPLILGQKYPAGFQVIVVVEQGDHETEDIVKRFRTKLDNEPGDASLYMTYIPESSRYMSRKKLAITLGVKAAKTEWLVFTEAYSRPATDRWLLTMAENCHDYTRLVIGYGCYDEDGVSAFKRFERLYAASYLMREDTRGTAYTTLSHNVMLRKSNFMQQEGFRGNLELIRGEYDFLVNKYAVEDATALETRSDAWMVDDAPTRKSWMNKHIFYAETRKTLQRSGRHRAWFNIDQTLLHLSLWLSVAGIAVGAALQNVVLLGAAILSLVISIVMRTVFGCRALKAFDESVPVLLVYPYELSVVWHNAGYLLRHRLADERDFTTHKE